MAGSESKERFRRQQVSSVKARFPTVARPVKADFRTVGLGGFQLLD